MYGTQPAQQIGRFGGLENRIAVGQINTGQTTLGQRIAHQLGLAPSPHQHRNIGRAQGPLQFFGTGAQTCALLLGSTEPGRDLRGRRSRHVLAVDGLGHAGARRFGFAVGVGCFFLVFHILGQQSPASECRHGSAVDEQGLLAPMCGHRHERHRVGTVLAKAESAAVVLFRLGEAEVDRIDHRRGGAVVGAQRIVAPGGGLAGAQVGVNVGPAESVDRLLGVANHEKALRGLVGFDAVNALENAVLQRIGVLELVDHRHRELLAYALGQSLAAIGLQGGIEALQKIVKTQLGAALFLQLQGTLHVHQGMAQQQRAQLGGGGRSLFASV